MSPVRHPRQAYGPQIEQWLGRAEQELEKALIFLALSESPSVDLEATISKALKHIQIAKGDEMT